MLLIIKIYTRPNSVSWRQTLTDVRMLGVYVCIFVCRNVCNSLYVFVYAYTTSMYMCVYIVFNHSSLIISVVCCA